MTAPLDPALPSNLDKLAAYPAYRLAAVLASLLVLRWADLQEADQEAVAAFDGTPFTPTLPPGTRWRDFCNARGEILTHAFVTDFAPSVALIRDAGAGALARRVSHIFLKYTHDVDDEPRDLLVDFVQGLPLATPADRDQSLDRFDDFVRRLTAADAHPVELFVTPRPVVDLVVELASPQPGERVYDPCFGVASMLAACARRVRARLKTAAPRAWIEAQRGAFLGVELRPEAFVVGLARMILAGVDRPALELGNTLERALPRDRAAEGFDCIVAEPPFGGRLAIDAATQFAVKATSAEALFLQHVAASLRPGGRAVVVLAQGAFFRGGADAAVRRMLLDEYRVEAVVSHLPYTETVKAGVLLLRREPPAARVRFVDLKRPAADLPTPEPGAPLFDPAVVAASVRGDATAYEVRDVPVADLAKDDASFMPPREDGPLPSFVQAVRAADASVPVQALEEVADLFAGLRTRAGDLTSGRAEPTLLGLLGPSEVEGGETRAPVRFLAKGVAVPPNLRLRSGDVLLTSAGVLGRAAVVANGATGHVAGNGLALVRPREGLSPHYLAALLQSAPYRAWMAERARGSTVESLPLSVLRRVSIPVPELARQDRVLRIIRRNRGDASAALLQVLGAIDDPITNWLKSSGPVQQLLAMQEGYHAEDAVLLAIEPVAWQMQPLRDRVMLDGDAQPLSLMIWAVNTATALAPLMGIERVPKGPARLAILERAHRRVEDALRALNLDETRPAFDMPGDLSRVIVVLLEGLAERCAACFKMVASFEPKSLDAGTAAALTVRVRNEGPTAVRDVVIEGSRSTYRPAEWSAASRFDAPEIKLEGKADYLDAGQEVVATAAVLAPPDAGAIDFHVSWRGRRLDGSIASDSLPFTLEVRASAAPTVEVDLGASPYIVGSPVEQREMLYGRDAVLRTIKRQLATTHRANVVLLEGNRRTGKTSILRRLQAPGEIPGWIAVDVNLQGAEGKQGRAGLSSTEIFRKIARDLAFALHKAGTPVWLPETPPSKRDLIQLGDVLTAYFATDHPFEALEGYVREVIPAVAPRRVLFMLDEFDKIQEGIDAGVTSPQVPENVRYLLQTYPELGGILSGSRRLTRLRNEYWSALFGIGYPVRVGALEEADARALVTGPAAGQLVYAQDARDRIVELCARQPFLIQTLCNWIFEEAAERGERAVTPDAVARAAAAMTGDNEHFETLWGYAGTDRRRLILALLCQLSRDVQGRALDAGVLEDDLAGRGIRVPPGGIGEDIAHLRELDLCELETVEGYQRYRVAVPLIVEWVLRNKDFSDLVKRAARDEDDADG